MPITFNGTSLTVVNFNGTTCNQVYFNGTLVYTSVQQAVAPSISYVFDPGRSRYTISITNQDSGAATLRSDINNSNPTTIRGTGITQFSSVSYNYTSSFPGFTIYATAEVSGKTLSNVSSIFV
jgi:hypothetical protein